jgi:hypothetical protein
MAGFDVDTLLEFDPPSFLCEKCLAIIPTSDGNFLHSDRMICSVCGVQYIGEMDYADYLKSQPETGVYFADPFEHARKLARLARRFLTPRWAPPISVLFDVLNHAQQFVHFMTFNIDSQIIGALKLLSRRVFVRGIVGSASSWIYDDLYESGFENPHLRCLAYHANREYDGRPHQKLVVVDGLLALHGSANLSLTGWRMIEKGREMLEVVTDIEKIRLLHNNNFSALWGQGNSVSDHITMSKAIRRPPPPPQLRRSGT